ncbi:MAG: Gfo/Idh/MocA family oxidoreductase [Candidatus Marinimicrobia bacterium]|nr:Gfo/Idh/MocA family oxidoreductase [Candidatus Neomarinimicrobiota bacterium]
MNRPLQVGIIGMGGFARTHHRVVRELEAAGRARLRAACDPGLAQFDVASDPYEFAQRGVEAFRDYREMLAAVGRELDVVHVPTPIHLHAEMHGACVAAGIPCLLEKPPSLDPAELSQMLATEQAAGWPTQVAFHMVAEPGRQALRARLLAGEFGALERVTLRALWPRGDNYYRRNDWAGRLRWRDGRLLLDSCIGNACSHYLHNALLWCGRDAVLAWAAPVAVRAELYRARASIEGPDAVFAEVETDTGVPLRLAVAHASAGPAEQCETLECARARITYDLAKQGVVIQWADGRRETLDGGGGRHAHLQSVAAYYDFLRGAAERPLSTLPETVPFVQLNGLIYVAAGGIAAVPAECVTRQAGSAVSGPVEAIEGLAAVADAFLARGEFPSAQGVAWGRPGGRAEAGDLVDLGARIRRALPAPD